MEPKHDLPDPLIITGGDPAGLAPELLASIASAIATGTDRVVYFCTGNERHVDDFVGHLGSPAEYRVEHDCTPRAPGGGILIIPVGERGDREAIRPGSPSEQSGRLALLALECGIAWARLGTAGMLTAPLSKEWVSRAGAPAFTGHTGHLAQAFSRSVVMLMHGERISVIPLTIHVPLAAVPTLLRRETENTELLPLLQAVAQLAPFQGRKWALLGLNPHAGEGGHLGTEEVEWLCDLAAAWRRQGLQVEGPIPADAAFLPEVRDEYRVFLGCYHDQVLVPFKALEGRRGINCTIGLPFIRTSPDHGTGFAIAGKAKGDPGSMLLAWEFLLRNAVPEVLA